MVTAVYQWIIIICVILLLAVHPTIEIFVRTPSARVGVSQSQEDASKIVMHEKQLTFSSDEQTKGRPGLNPRTQVTQHMPSPSRAKKAKRLRRKRDGDALASQTQQLKDHQFVVPNTAAPPPCARGGGDTFCVDVDEYPVEHVLRVLKKEPVVLRTFFQDERKQFTLTEDVQDRIDASDENPLCVAQEHTVYPKMAKNIEGNWLFVINHDEYVQGVRVEQCLTDRECSFPMSSLPNGYRSQCKQKYIYRKLVALNGTGQGVISDSFQFPSCCSCVIKLDPNFAHNRFGGGGGVAAALPLTLPKTTPTPSPLRHKPKS